MTARPVRILRAGVIIDADVQPHIEMDACHDVNRLIVAVMRARIHGMHGPLEYRATAQAIGEIEVALVGRELKPANIYASAECLSFRGVPFVLDESVPWVDLCEQTREQESS